MTDPWAEDAPIRRQHHGCLVFTAFVIVAALVVGFVATFIAHVLFDVVIGVAIVVVCFGLAKFFRGPPDT